MKNKRRESFIVAVDQREAVEQNCSVRPLPVQREPNQFFNKLISKVADNFLDDPKDQQYYADKYKCWPPPFFILSISLISLILFIYHSLTHEPKNYLRIGPIPTDHIFIYSPDKKIELWRWIFYSVLHANWTHLIFNLTIQLLIGLPLEMVHGSARISIIYMAGVLAGSLGTSIFDPQVHLVGASGGVYALLAAHFANVILNYNQMEAGLLRIFGIFLIVSADVGYAVYERYSSKDIVDQLTLSYVAHFAGAVAGLTIGLVILKNFAQNLLKQCVWWLSLSIYLTCMVLAIMYNIYLHYKR